MAWNFIPTFQIRDDQVTFGDLIIDSSVVPIIKNLLIDVLGGNCNIPEYRSKLENRVFTNEGYSQAQKDYDIVVEDLKEMNKILKHGSIRGTISTWSMLVEKAGQYALGSKSWIQNYVDLRTAAIMAFMDIEKNDNILNVDSEKMLKWSNRYSKDKGSITEKDILDDVMNSATIEFDSLIESGKHTPSEARDMIINNLRKAGKSESKYVRQVELLLATKVTSTNVTDISSKITKEEQMGTKIRLTTELINSITSRIEQLPPGSEKQAKARLHWGRLFIEAMVKGINPIAIKTDITDCMFKTMVRELTPDVIDIISKKYNELVNIARYKDDRFDNSKFIYENCYLIDSNEVESYFLELVKKDSEYKDNDVIQVTANHIDSWYSVICDMRNINAKYTALKNFAEWLCKEFDTTKPNIGEWFFGESIHVKALNDYLLSNQLNISELNVKVSNVVIRLTRTYSYKVELSNIQVRKSWLDSNILMISSNTTSSQDTMINVSYENLMKWYHTIEEYPNIKTQADALAALGNLILKKLALSSVLYTNELASPIEEYTKVSNPSMYYGSLRESVSKLIELTKNVQYTASEHKIAETELNTKILLTNESKFK